MLSRKFRSVINGRTSHFMSQTIRSTSLSFSTLPVETPTPVEKKKMTPFQIYFTGLSKGGLSATVAMTAMAGYLCAAVSPFDAITFGGAFVGTFMVAGSAATFNHVLEIDQDALMPRTCKRPLPAGIISKNTAIKFGAGMGVAGTALLLATTNPVVAALGAANLVLYSGVYTYSKRHTEWNTWIGAGVGAIPPLMGWAAATGGSIMAMEPAAMTALMFLWQFPHFFALAWQSKDSYKRSNFQMVCCNDPDGSRTSRLITGYTLALTAFPFVTCALDLTTYMFLVEGLVLNGGALYFAYKFDRDRSSKNAGNVFIYSIVYIIALLSLFGFHSRKLTDKNKLEDEDQMSSVVHALKDTLRGKCPHETMNHNEDGSHLCAKLAVDKVIDSAGEVVVPALNCDGAEDKQQDDNETKKQ